MTAAVVSICRALVAMLTTRRRRVWAFEKLVRGTVLVPVFGAALVAVRVRARLAGPLVRGGEADGIRFECRLPDLIQTYLYLFGVWEPDVTSFVRGRLSPGDAFIDVGANIGYHALLASRQLGGDGRVVAIEASPGIYARLRANLMLNGDPANVRTVNMAVTDARRECAILEGPAHNVGLSTTVRSRKSRRFPTGATVAGAPLADLLEPDEIRTARLVKIDVEGAEDLVIEGLAGFLAACRPDVEIIVELSPPWWRDPSSTPRQALRVLLDAGFHAYRIDNNLWPWRYLWPNDVRPPRRIREPLDRRVKRLDLVMSRLDQEEL